MAVGLAGTMLVESGLDSATRFSFRFLIDEIIHPRHQASISFIFALLGVAAAAVTACCIIGDYLWAKLGTLVVNDLRAELLMKLQALPMEFHTQRSSGDLLNCVMADAESIENALVTVVPYAAVGLAGIGFSLVFMGTIHVGLTCFAFLGLIVCFALPRLLGTTAQKSALEVRQRQGHMAACVQEILQSQPITKAFGLERELLRRFGHTRNLLVTASVRSNFFSYTTQRIPLLAFFLLALLVLMGSAQLTARGTLSVGELVAFQVMMLGLTSGIANLTWLGPVVLEARASFERINQIFREHTIITENETGAPLARLSRSINLREVSFAYPQSANREPRRVLDGVSATIRMGELTVIVGPSGAGKSTLLNLILRFYDPTSGHIMFDGVEISKVRLSSLRAQIGLVTQETWLFAGSIGDNLRMGKLGASEDELWAALSVAGIANDVREQPTGLGTELGERGAQWSVGQRQRLALARALIRQPAVLLLDEPTSSLDAQNESDIFATLRELTRASKMTVIAVTHRLSLAATADQVLVLSDGCIEASGRHEELLATKGTYVSLWAKTATRDT